MTRPGWTKTIGMAPILPSEQRATPPPPAAGGAARSGTRALALLALAAAACGLTGCERLSRLAHHDQLYQRLMVAPWIQLPPPPDSALFWHDTLLVRAERVDRETTLAVHYQPYVIGDKHAVWNLRLGVGESRFQTALRVSRTDVAHVQKGDTLVVPSKSDTPLLSPFPDELPVARAIHKLMLVSLRVQAYGAYEEGELERWGPTSTGRRDKPTPPGIYFANWKSRERHSTIDENWLLKWEVNLDQMEGIAIHEFGLPGRPASHSCVRFTQEDAEWFFGWVDSWKVAPDRSLAMRRGTPVAVFGGYLYDQRRPWLKLPDDPRATRVTSEELESVVAAYFFCGPPMPAPEGPPMPAPHANVGRRPGWAGRPDREARPPVIAERPFSP